MQKPNRNFGPTELITKYLVWLNFNAESREQFSFSDLYVNNVAWLELDLLDRTKQEITNLKKKNIIISNTIFFSSG